MKNTMKIRMIGAAALLGIGASAFPSLAAAKIQQLSVYIRGEEPKPGQFLDDTLPELETSGDKYYIHQYEYANERVQWDRRDTPVLMLEIYYDSEYKLMADTVHKIKIKGMDCTYERAEWIDKDEMDEESGVRGVRIYLKFPAFSTPGAGASRRMAEIEKEAVEAEAKSKKKAALIRNTEVADGWYKDCFGWWYLESDGTYHASEWKGSDSAGWSYLNADGYAATGWFEIGDQWYFSDENGSLLTNTVTPDGYRVDGSGAWVH